MSLSRIRRVRSATVAGFAAVLLLSGCGGDGEPASADPSGSATSTSPTATATSPAESPGGSESAAAGAEGFCDNFLGGAASGAGGPEEWAEALRGADLPEDMPQQAQDGLDRLLTLLQETAENPAALQQKLLSLGTKAQQEVQAFGLYVASTCREQLEQLMEDLPSDLPSGLPSDLPTELPSDLPTDGS